MGVGRHHRDIVNLLGNHISSRNHELRLELKEKVEGSLDDFINKGEVNRNLLTYEQIASENGFSDIISDIDFILSSLGREQFTVAGQPKQEITKAEFKLQEYLSLDNHLEQVEPGLAYVDQEVIIDEGRLDILATDRLGSPITLELKMRDYNDDKVAGQIRKYRAGLPENRLIFVAPKIRPALYHQFNQEDIESEDLLFFRVKREGKKSYSFEFVTSENLDKPKKQPKIKKSNGKRTLSENIKVINRPKQPKGKLVQDIQQRPADEKAEPITINGEPSKIGMPENRELQSPFKSKVDTLMDVGTAHIGGPYSGSADEQIIIKQKEEGHLKGALVPISNLVSEANLIERTGMIHSDIDEKLSDITNTSFKNSPLFQQAIVLYRGGAILLDLEGNYNTSISNEQMRKLQHLVTSNDSKLLDIAQKVYEHDITTSDLKNMNKRARIVFNDDAEKSWFEAAKMCVFARRNDKIEHSKKCYQHLITFSELAMGIPGFQLQNSDARPLAEISKLYETLERVVHALKGVLDTTERVADTTLPYINQAVQATTELLARNGNKDGKFIDRIISELISYPEFILSQYLKNKLDRVEELKKIDLELAVAYLAFNPRSMAQITAGLEKAHTIPTTVPNNLTIVKYWREDQKLYEDILSHLKVDDEAAETDQKKNRVKLKSLGKISDDIQRYVIPLHDNLPQMAQSLGGDGVMMIPQSDNVMAKVHRIRIAQDYAEAGFMIDTKSGKLVRIDEVKNFHKVVQQESAQSERYVLPTENNLPTHVPSPLGISLMVVQQGEKFKAQRVKIAENLVQQGYIIDTMTGKVVKRKNIETLMYGTEVQTIVDKDGNERKIGVLKTDEIDTGKQNMPSQKPILTDEAITKLEDLLVSSDLLDAEKKSIQSQANQSYIPLETDRVTQGAKKLNPNKLTRLKEIYPDECNLIIERQSNPRTFIPNIKRYAKESSDYMENVLKKTNDFEQLVRWRSIGDTSTGTYDTKLEKILHHFRLGKKSQDVSTIINHLEYCKIALEDVIEKYSEIQANPITVSVLDAFKRAIEAHPSETLEQQQRVAYLHAQYSHVSHLGINYSSRLIMQQVDRILTVIDVITSQTKSNNVYTQLSNSGVEGLISLTGALIEGVCGMKDYSQITMANLRLSADDSYTKIVNGIKKNSYRPWRHITDEQRLEHIPRELLETDNLEVLLANEKVRAIFDSNAGTENYQRLALIHPVFRRDLLDAAFFNLSQIYCNAVTIITRNNIDDPEQKKDDLRIFLDILKTKFATDGEFIALITDKHVRDQLIDPKSGELYSEDIINKCKLPLGPSDEIPSYFIPREHLGKLLFMYSQEESRRLYEYFVSNVNSQDSAQITKNKLVLNLDESDYQHSAKILEYLKEVEDKDMAQVGYKKGAFDRLRILCETPVADRPRENNGNIVKYKPQEYQDDLIRRLCGNIDEVDVEVGLYVDEWTTKMAEEDKLTIDQRENLHSALRSTFGKKDPMYTKLMQHGLPFVQRFLTELEERAVHPQPIKITDVKAIYESLQENGQT